MDIDAMDIPTAKDVIKVGQSLPSIELTEGTPLTRVNITDICKNKKVVLFGVVGAFTPGCSLTHLPGFVEKSSELKRKGYHEIICVTVNDIFVTDAWGRDQGAEGKVRMLADPDGGFIKALGLDIHIPILGGIRSKRFSMIVVNNIVKQLAVEPDATGLTCSLADSYIPGYNSCISGRYFFIGSGVHSHLIGKEKRKKTNEQKLRRTLQHFMLHKRYFAPATGGVLSAVGEKPEVTASMSSGYDQDTREIKTRIMAFTRMVSQAMLLPNWMFRRRWNSGYSMHETDRKYSNICTPGLWATDFKFAKEFTPSIFRNMTHFRSREKGNARVQL